jgi:hypothetical protein
MSDGTDESDKNLDENTNKTGIQLELGDIIQIIAPSNEGLDEETFLITYIDDSKIKIINISTLQVQQLNIDEESYISDESIRKVFLLSRSDVAGYARQNNLLPQTWIEIHFGGDVPVIITGEVTNLDEDMIEVTTYPELEVIYIDFQYKGILDDLPIEKIMIREKPAALGKYRSLADIKDIMEEGEIPELEDEEATMEFTDTGESIIRIPDTASPNDNIRDVLQAVYLDANDIFGEDLESIVQLIEVPEREKRYGIDIQVNDLMDELLSTIPNSRRTSTVLENIHNLVERFKELREKFSKFDENGNVTDVKMVGPLYKPLIQHIQKMDTNLKWLVPVVSQRKTIVFDSTRDIENREDIVSVVAGNDLESQQNIQEDYFKNRMHGDELKYERMYTRLESESTSFHPPEADDNFLTFDQEVATNLDSIVNNLDEFYSTVLKKSDIARRRYVIQRYNLGLSKIDSKHMKSGKKIYNRTNLTPNDKIALSSLIMLPESAVTYSRVDLPGTNILVKSQLSQHVLHLSRIFKQKLKVNSHVVDDLTKELDYDDVEKDSNVQFLKGIKEYSLDASLDGEDDKYRQFLNTIVPKTRSLIRHVTKLNKDLLTNEQLSLIDVVRALEPFAIYTEDITYPQYMEIRYFIKEQLNEHKKSLVKRAKEFDEIRSAKYTFAKATINRIEKMLSEKRELFEWFVDSYKIPEDKMATYGPSELLFRINRVDDGTLYLNLLTFMLMSLITPNKLLIGTNMPNVDDLTNTEKIRAKDCARRFISKRYLSIRELQKDNNSENVYYDDEFDDTPYSILKKYKDQQKQMLPELFVEFMTESLVQKHDCPPMLAKELAETLIAGKKQVSDGEYAILEIRPQLPESIDKSKLSEKEKEEIEREANVRVKTQYYHRLKNNWVLDKNVDEESFIDTNALFCNLSKVCNKNQTLNTCESNELAENRLKNISHARVIKEFDKRFSVTVEELEKELDATINHNRKIIRKTKQMNEIRLHKANNLAYELGKYANSEDIVESPYAKLRDLILAQSDFVKKQNDICRLMEKYCREPMVTELNEEFHWAYCKETNTKLLPYSIFQLANAYISGDDYQQKQDHLCRTIGILSDDGDSIVDKHSGYVLKQIDFSTEEGYDEAGFKMTTHEILEKDLGTVVSEALKDTGKKVFEDETTEMVYNVFSRICINLGIPPDSIEEFVVRVSIELINNKDVILGEDAYVKRAEKTEKTKGTVSVPFLIYRNQTIITIIGCILIIAIQTATPSFKTKNTFPGCVRSFSGFPMTGIEETSGLLYIACVIDKTKSKDIKPWDSIEKLNAGTLLKRMKTVLQSYILTRNDISELYLKKKEYSMLHPDQIVPEEHGIERWWQFLPPVVPFTINKTLHGVSSDYEKEMLTLMQKGSKDQREHLDMFHSKIIQHTYGIVESINAVVKNKNLLLKTASQMPFLENACCNESDKPVNPISYFIDADPSIDVNIRKSHKMATIIGNVKDFSKAAILYSPQFTGTVFPTLPTGHNEANIYGAFVHYCNFDRDAPISDDLTLICSEKPQNYTRIWSIEEKVEFLKKHGKQYNIDNLDHLMEIIHRRNLVMIPEPKINSPTDILKDLLISMDQSDSTVVEEPLRRLLGDVIEAHNPRVMQNTNPDEQNEFIVKLVKLKKYLDKTNEKMLLEITTFLKNDTKLSVAKHKAISAFLKNIDVWNLDTDKNDGLFSVTQFIKNSIFAMVKNYPNILLNSANYNTLPAIMVDMSREHKIDVSNFVKKYSDDLSKFKGDPVLTRLLQVVSERLTDLNLLVEHLTVQTSIQKNGETLFSLFDKPATYKLFVYCWYAVFYEYIMASKDIDLIRLDIQVSKETTREQIKERKDQNFGANVQNVANEIQDELDQIQISAGDQVELKTNVCSLLLAFIDIEQQNKKTLDYSYDQITKRVVLSRTAEKKSITDFLENMEKDERGVEKMLKKYKIGRWNAGMQKGLFQYDKDTYDREHDANIARLFQDLDIHEDPGATVEDLEREAEADADKDAEQPAIDHLDEDYNDGVYYDEDRDDDDNDNY